MVSEKEMKRRVREKIEALAYGTIIQDEWLLEIFQCHPEWKEKTQDGKRCIVKTYGLNNDFKLVIKEADEEKDNFSWIKSIKGHLNHSLRYVIAKEARRLIQYQISHFRLVNNVPSVGYDIDHCEIDFKDILNNWLGTINKTMENITLEELRCHGQDWMTYHQKHASLQAVSKQEHKLLTKKRKLIEN